MTNYEACQMIIAIGIPGMIIIMAVMFINMTIESVRNEADYDPDYWFNRVKRTLGFKYLSERKIMDSIEEAIDYAENCPYMDDYVVENRMTRDYVVLRIYRK